MSSLETFQNSDPQECLMCNLRWEYDIVQFTFPLKFYCKHSKRWFSSKPFVHFSKPLQLVTLFIQFLLAVPIIPYFFYFPVLCQNNKLACLSLLSDQIFIIISLFMVTVVTLNIKKLQVEIDAWLYLFENRIKYNLVRVIEAADCRKFKLYGFLGALIVIIYLFVPFFYFDHTSNKIGTFLRKFAISASFGCQGKAFFEMLKSINIHSVVLKALGRSLKAVLTRRLLFPSLPKNQSSGNVFRKFYEVISIINTCVNIHFKTFTFVVGVWSLLSVVSMILNIYIWILFAIVLLLFNFASS